MKNKKNSALHKRRKLVAGKAFGKLCLYRKPYFDCIGKYFEKSAFFLSNNCEKFNKPRMKNWNTFTKRILVNKPIEDVYRCWSTKSQIETWFLEKADFKSNNELRKLNELVQKGDQFHWKWHNWNFVEKGEILQANGKDSISFTFGSGGNVHVDLKIVDSSTEIILKQDDIPTDEKSKREIFVGCITGWTFWLTNLKAYLEYGITLHSKGLKQEDTIDLVNS